MATHSSLLAWRIPGAEEPGGLQSMGLQRVGHDLVTKLQCLCVCWTLWFEAEPLPSKALFHSACCGLR